MPRSHHRGWPDFVLWDTRGTEEPTEVGRIDVAPEETEALAWSLRGDLLATGGESSRSALTRTTWSAHSMEVPLVGEATTVWRR